MTQMPVLPQARRTTAPLHRGRRGLVTVVVVSALVIAALEFGLRAIEPRLPEPLRWPGYDMGVKYDQLAAIGAAGEDVDVLIVGSSHIEAGIDPLVVREVAGTSGAVYNAALSGQPPAVVARWTTDVAVPTVHPRAVVIGLSTGDLWDAFEVRPGEPEEDLLRSQGYRQAVGSDDPLLRIARAAAEVSAVVRYREALREPSSIIDALQGERRGRPQRRAERIGPYGRNGTEDPAQPYANAPAWLAVFGPTIDNPIDMQGDKYDEVRALITQLRAMSIDVALVTMPTVSADYLSVHPHGQEDLDAYRRIVSALAAQTDVAYLDLSPVADTRDLFRDPIHLNHRGRELVSTALAEWLAAEVLHTG